VFARHMTTKELSFLVWEGRLFVSMLKISQLWYLDNQHIKDFTDRECYKSSLTIGGVYVLKLLHLVWLSDLF
jgi:hypothetical protein